MENIPQTPIQRIGIDKLVLRNFRVEYIDFKKLRQSGHVTVNPFSLPLYGTLYDESGAPIKSIIVQDNIVFSDLQIGCTNNNGYISEYVFLTLTVSHARGDNMKNMSWTEYDYYLTCAIGYIAETYGICLDASEVKLKSIEINCNVLLSQPYQNYFRVLALLADFTPKWLKQSASYGKAADTSGTHLRRSKKTEIVFYDKNAQAKKGTRTALPSQDHAGSTDKKGLLRIELRLLQPDKIRSALGSDLWKDLDDMVIADYYCNTIRQWYIKHFACWKLECIRKLKKEIRSARSQSIKNWHHILIHKLKNTEIRLQKPYILDIEQLFDAIREMPGRSSNCSHRIQIIKRTRCEKDVFWNHDLQKVQEIMDGIASAYETSKKYAGINTTNML